MANFSGLPQLLNQLQPPPPFSQPGNYGPPPLFAGPGIGPRQPPDNSVPWATLPAPTPGGNGSQAAQQMQFMSTQRQNGGASMQGVDQYNRDDWRLRQQAAPPAMAGYGATAPANTAGVPLPPPRANAAAAMADAPGAMAPVTGAPPSSIAVTGTGNIFDPQSAVINGLMDLGYDVTNRGDIFIQRMLKRAQDIIDGLQIDLAQNGGLGNPGSWADAVRQRLQQAAAGENVLGGRAGGLAALANLSGQGDAGGVAGSVAKQLLAKPEDVANLVGSARFGGLDPAVAAASAGGLTSALAQFPRLPATTHGTLLDLLLSGQLPGLR